MGDNRAVDRYDPVPNPDPPRRICRAARKDLRGVVCSKCPSETRTPAANMQGRRRGHRHAMRTHRSNIMMAILPGYFDANADVPIMPIGQTCCLRHNPPSDRDLARGHVFPDRCCNIYRVCHKRVCVHGFAVWRPARGACGRAGLPIAAAAHVAPASYRRPERTPVSGTVRGRVKSNRRQSVALASLLPSAPRLPCASRRGATVPVS